MNMAQEAGPGLSGLEQLRALMASGRNAGIGATLDAMNVIYERTNDLVDAIAKLSR